MSPPLKIGQPRFLRTEEVLAIHETLINQYGGAHSVLDEAAIDAAMAMPSQGVGGQYAHEFPFGMAAAYGFRLAMGHPFRDGNKRIAFGAMVVFFAPQRLAG